MKLKDKIKITHLTMSGGGLHGAVTIGALRFLYSEGLQENITHISSSSIGSFIALMIIFKLSIEEMEKVMKNIINSDKTTIVLMKDILNIFNTFGCSSTENVLEHLKIFLFQKYNKHFDDFTFADVKNMFNMNLYISVTNVNKCCNEILSFENTPDVPVFVACKASMSVPLIYQPVNINNNYYFDGGLTNNFPISIFDNIPDENKLGIALNAKDNIIINSEPKENINFLYIFQNTLQTLRIIIVKETLIKYLDKSYVVIFENIPSKILEIKNHNKGLKLFDIHNDKIDEMTAIGFNEMYSYMTRRGKNI